MHLFSFLSLISIPHFLQMEALLSPGISLSSYSKSHLKEYVTNTYSFKSFITLESMAGLMVLIQVYFYLFKSFYELDAMKWTGDIFMNKADTFLMHGNYRLPREIGITLIIALINI